jgi:site-specific recombinase XerD
MAKTPPAIKQFRAYLERRRYASHTVVNYCLDLQLFFAQHARPPATITHQDVEHFVELQSLRV